MIPEGTIYVGLMKEKKKFYPRLILKCCFLGLRPFRDHLHVKLSTNFLSHPWENLFITTWEVMLLIFTIFCIFYGNKNDINLWGHIKPKPIINETLKSSGGWSHTPWLVFELIRSNTDTDGAKEKKTSSLLFHVTDRPQITTRNKETCKNSPNS